MRWLGGVDGVLELIDQTLLRENCGRFNFAMRNRFGGDQVIARARRAGDRNGGCLWRRIGMQSAVDRDRDEFLRRLDDVTSHLAASRPTAVNLSWALEE